MVSKKFLWCLKSPPFVVLVYEKGGDFLCFNGSKADVNKSFSKKFSGIFDKRQGRGGVLHKNKNIQFMQKITLFCKIFIHYKFGAVTKADKNRTNESQKGNKMVTKSEKLLLFCNRHLRLCLV